MLAYVFRRALGWNGILFIVVVSLVQCPQAFGRGKAIVNATILSFAEVHCSSQAMG